MILDLGDQFLRMFQTNTDCDPFRLDLDLAFVLKDIDITGGMAGS